MNPHQGNARASATALGCFAALWLGLWLMAPAGSHGAGSQFELDIGELDRRATPARPVKDKPAQPARKPKPRTKTRPKLAEPIVVKGDYLTYTIRSGEHIHKILTSRFGMSSAKAEELTPVIMRINGISDPSGLMIGQTILIPASAVGAAVPVQSGSSAPGAPPVQDAKVPAPTRSTGTDDGMLRRIRKFWAALSPEKTAPEDEIREKTVGNDRYPVVAARNGKEIIIAPPGNPPVFANMSGARVESATVAVIEPADGKKLASTLLVAAGYESVEEQVSFQFGDDPKLRLTADLMGVKRDSGQKGFETALVVADQEGCLPSAETLAVFLAGRGYRFAELCSAPLIPTLLPKIRVYSVPSGGSAALVDTLLDAFSLRWSRTQPIEVMVGRKDAAPLRVTVDRYFEEQGGRFFVDFGSEDPGHATMARMLELAGYRRIAVNARDDLRAVAAKIMKPLNFAAAYRRYTFAVPGRCSVEVTGVLVPKALDNGVIPFVTDVIVDPVLSDLINSGQWEIH